MRGDVADNRNMHLAAGHHPEFQHCFLRWVCATEKSFGPSCGISNHLGLGRCLLRIHTHISLTRGSGCARV